MRFILNPISRYSRSLTHDPSRRTFIRAVGLSGVVTLAATVIGYVYADVGRLDRALFALSSLLLMAPGLLVSGTYDVLELVGVASGEVTLFVDLVLRGVGLAMFVALLLRNRRRGTTKSEVDATPEAA